MEAERGPPASQIALEGERVIGELARGEVVRRSPSRAPVARRTERHIQRGGLPARDVPLLRGGIGAAACARKCDTERESAASAAATDAPADSEAESARSVWRPRAPVIAPKVVRSLTQLTSGVSRRRRRRNRLGTEPEQATQTLQRRGRHGEGCREVGQEWAKLRRVGADLPFPQIVRDL